MIFFFFLFKKFGIDSRPFNQSQDELPCKPKVSTQIHDKAMIWNLQPATRGQCIWSQFMIMSQGGIEGFFPLLNE